MWNYPHAVSCRWIKNFMGMKFFIHRHETFFSRTCPNMKPTNPPATTLHPATLVVSTSIAVWGRSDRWAQRRAFRRRSICNRDSISHEIAFAKNLDSSYLFHFKSSVKDRNNYLYSANIIIFFIRWYFYHIICTFFYYIILYLSYFQCIRCNMFRVDTPD